MGEKKGKSLIVTTLYIPKIRGEQGVCKIFSRIVFIEKKKYV